MLPARTMHKLLAILLTITLPLGLFSCGGDSHAGLAKEQQAEMSSLVSILKGITDEASAEAAKDKMSALGERMAAIAKRAEALGEPTPEEAKALLEELGDNPTDGPMGKMIGEMTAEMMRLQSIPGAQAVIEQMSTMMEGK